MCACLKVSHKLLKYAGKKGTNFRADVKKRKKEDFCVLMTVALRFSWPSTGVSGDLGPNPGRLAETMTSLNQFQSSPDQTTVTPIN